MKTLTLLSYDLTLMKALAMAQYLDEIGANYTLFISSPGRLFIVIPVSEGK